MSPEAIIFRELSDLNDDLLLPWLDLYEIAFPPCEKMLVSGLLKIIKNKAAGLKIDKFIIAAHDPNKQFLGLALYEVVEKYSAAFLWYLAVCPEARNMGLGGRFYQEVIRRIEPHHLKAALFEVEIPEEAATREGGALAKRRIVFYQRQGAFLMKGIRYWQRVGPHQPPVPMHIMVHPFAILTPDECFELAHSVFGDNISRVGDIEIE